VKGRKDTEREKRPSTPSKSTGKSSFLGTVSRGRKQGVVQHLGKGSLSEEGHERLVEGGKTSLGSKSDFVRGVFSKGSKILSISEEQGGIHLNLSISEASL